MRYGLVWLAAAAGILVAFGIGLMQGGRTNTIATVAPEGREQLADAAPALPDLAVPEANPDDALTLWVRDDAGQPRSVRVPLVDANTLDRALGVTFQSAIPAALRERLQDRGYDVESKRRYAPLWLENGRPMIVPVEDTKIVPVSQRVY